MKKIIIIITIIIVLLLAVKVIKSKRQSSRPIELGDYSVVENSYEVSEINSGTCGQNDDGYCINFKEKCKTGFDEIGPDKCKAGGSAICCIPLGQSTTNYESSPFGFLNQYIENPKTKQVYAAYGGFPAIQKVYKDLDVHWDRGSGDKGGAIWGKIEKNINGYADVFKKYVDTADKNGINLLITVEPGYSKVGEGEKLPTDLNAYAGFVTKLVQDYPTVKYWQIHNEVNGNVFWKDTPKNYAELVRVTSNAVREGCPNCKVVLGSSINIDAKTNPKSIASYFDPVLKELGKDGKKYFDVFDYHFFPPKGYTPDSYYRSLNKDIDSVKSLLGKYGNDNVDIWITETMIPTTKGMSKKEIQKLPEEYRIITEDQHAQALIKTYILALSKGVKKIFWNKLTEGPWFNHVFNRAGLIRHPNYSGSADKKLAYYTYKKMVEILEGSDWNNIQTIQESNNIYIYKFTKNGKPVWVAWNDNINARTVSLDVGNINSAKITEAVPKYETGKNVKGYNAAFNTEIKTIQNSKINIILKDIPVFIEQN